MKNFWTNIKNRWERFLEKIAPYGFENENGFNLGFEPRELEILENEKAKNKRIGKNKP